VAVTFNTTIDQGADWFLNFQYKNPNNTPIILTNYTAALQIRTSPLAKTAVLTLTSPSNGIVITGNTGTIAVHATATQTANITNGKYAYDLEITAPAPDNTVTRLVQGTIEVSPQVTRTP
jgi:hypothetical protein